MRMMRHGRQVISPAADFFRARTATDQVYLGGPWSQSVQQRRSFLRAHIALLLIDSLEQLAALVAVIENY